MGSKKKKGSKGSETPGMSDNIIQFVPGPSNLPNDVREETGHRFSDENDWEVLAEADEFVYEAMNAETDEEAVRLARAALEITEDCADAWVLLGHYADSFEEAAENYNNGLEAAQRVLGEEFFQENAGHFWGILETRSFMRALFSLTNCMEDAGLLEVAVDSYISMLVLNPNDNQGARYPLMRLLVELQRDDEAEKLFEQYDEHIEASWNYSRVLIDFRKHGESRIADKSLEIAVIANDFVPDYLLGCCSIPEEFPVDYIVGEESEAAAYAFLSRHVWEADPDALAWLGLRT